MNSDEKKRILDEHFEIIACAAGELDKIPPGWMSKFEAFFKRVNIWNRTNDHWYFLQEIKITGLLVQVKFNIHPVNGAIRCIVLRLKSDCVHSCQICGDHSEMKAPLAGYSYCKPCYELFTLINEI